MAGAMLALGRGLKKKEETKEDPVESFDDHRGSQQTIDALMAEVKLKKEAKQSVHWLLDHKAFTVAVYTVIILNSVQMGLAVDYWEETGVWDACEHLFTSLFLIEMMIKLHFLRKAYFSDGWNRLDCFLVCLSILDNWMIKPAVGDGSALSQLSVLRVMRVLRIARMARLLKVFKELWIILKGILDSLRVMFWVTVLLLLTLYVCSILCVDILGRSDVGFDGFDDNDDTIQASLQIAGWNNFQYFGTMSRSMYTLFNIVILSEFTEIGRPALERQPAMILFFMVFIVFTTFGVLNVIIGVIVDNTMEAAKCMEQDLATRERNEKLALLLAIRDMVFALDVDKSGSISMEEVEEGWELKELQDLLADIDLPKGFTASELMCLLDADGDGELTFDEFMRSFYRLLMSNPFQMNCCMHASLNEVKQNVKLVQTSLEEEKDKHAADITEIKDSLALILGKLGSMEAAKGGAKKPFQKGSSKIITLPGMPTSNDWREE